jgi:hypothetical protein
MKRISKLITGTAATLCTFAFVAMATPAAQAGEYCMTNTSGMRGCGYSSLEQCQASASGITGSCARDPFYSDPNNALAYQPRQIRSRSEPRPAKPSAAH